MNLLYAVFILSSLGLVFGQKPSPCPSLFAYEPKGVEQDRWYGRLTVATVEQLTGIWLHITLDNEAELLGNWFGETITDNNKIFIIKNPEYIFQPNRDPLSVRFFVKYNIQGTIPSLIEIRLNGRIICASTLRAPTNEPSKLHISHVSPLNAGNSSQRPSSVFTTASSENNDDDFFAGDLSSSRRPIMPISNNIQNTCGTVKTGARPLITYGQNTIQGQWPWHAAIYRYKHTNMQYLCGGSLISVRHVLSAAHCVTKSKTNIAVNPKLLVVYLGKYHLFEQDYTIQNIGIVKITPHPDYNASYLYNDLAVLQLARPAEITDYVRFVCLWGEDTNLNSITERLGTVVGWGFDETGDVTETLMQAKMPVVSTEACIFSNREFFSRFTSDKTYCAGFRNGTSACTGDSGGGMVFPKSGTSGNAIIWQIRGVVSLSAALQNEKVVCDSSNYIVFTDVAKYLDWIQSCMSHT